MFLRFYQRNKGCPSFKHLLRSFVFMGEWNNVLYPLGVAFPCSYILILYLYLDFGEITES